MMLSIRQLPLQHEVIQHNKSMIEQLGRKNLYKVAEELGLPPDNKIVRAVFDAIKKGVKILKTDDVALLNFAAIIEMKLGIKVTHENKV